MRYSFFALFSLLIVGNAFGQRPVAHTADPTVRLLDRQFERYNLTYPDVAAIDATVQEQLLAGAPIVIDLALGDFHRTVELQAAGLLADDYARGRKVIAFKGQVQGNPTDRVRLTITDQSLYGYIESGAATYYVEPLAYLAGKPNAVGTVVYKAAHVRPNGGTCGVTEQAARGHDLPAAARQVGNCYVLDLALASDFSMFQKYGSVAAVEAHNIGVTNNVQGNYDDEFADEINIQIVTQFTPTTAAQDPFDPSTDAGDYLDSFRFWAQGGGFGGVAYDLGGAWTDRNFDGSTIGLAYVGVVCDNGFGYHVLEDFSANAQSLRVLTSHEMGHNFDLNHSDPNTIMAPSVNNSTVWSASSVADFNAYLSGLVGSSGNCLSSCGPPVAGFTASVTEVCPGGSIQFFNNSTLSPSSFNWSFPGGTPSTSTSPNPVVTYNNPGIFNVSLTATNSFGSDTQTNSNFITVSTSGNDVLFFDDFENGLINWTLVNPDGGATWSATTVPYFTQTNQGVFVNNYTYNAAGQRDDLISPAFDLTNRSSATFDLDYAYAPYDNTLIDTFVIDVSTNNGASYSRAYTGAQVNGFQFGTVPAQTNFFFPQSPDDWCAQSTLVSGCLSLDLSPWVGNAQVRVRITNVTGYGNNIFIDNAQLSASCLGTAAQPPVAGIGANVTTGCAPLTVQFSDQSTNAPTTRTWTFPGGTPGTSTVANPTVTYNTAGSYDVQLVVGNSGGQDTEVLTNYITVDQAPTAAFNVTATGGNSYQFAYTGSGATSFNWDFGDGTTSGSANPSHTFAGNGNYDVTLTVGNNCGTNSFTETIVLAAGPQASFTASAVVGCAPLAVTYDAQGSINADDYQWSFPGGIPATASGPTVTVNYGAAGSYDVVLTVNNAFGTDQDVRPNYINVADVPVPGFTAQVNDQTVTFVNTTSAGDSFMWDFGDSNTSTQTSPVHTYAADGTYTVTLTATNGCGTQTTTQPVNVSTQPFAQFSATNTQGCAPFTVQFNNLSSANSDTYAWTFPGGTPGASNAENPTVTYNVAGSFDVTLVVSNANGTNTADLSDYILVEQAPTASFSAVPTDLSVAFDATSPDATGYTWDFGDGNGSSQEDPTHVYATDGTYTVSLTVTNNCGTDVTTQTIVASTMPVAQFSATTTEGCTPFVAQFNNQSSGNATGFQWTFPGGTPGTSTAENPTVTYNNPGSYDVSLTVTNPSGTSTADLSDYILVGTAPTASFSSIVNDLVISLDATSANATSYSWDFGDGNSSTQEDPVHTYAADGTYTVSLTVGNDCGTDVTTQTVVIATLPSAQFAAATTQGCTPFSVQFNNQSSDNASTFAWTFPGGTPGNSTDENPTVVYNTAGTYDVTLTVTNSVGNSTETLTDYISVGSAPVADFNALPNDLVVAFNAMSPNADSYSWNFGDGNSSTDPDPVHTYAAVGTYQVSLTVTNGCGTDVRTQAVVVSSLPTAQFSAASTEGCAPFTVQFNNQSSDNASTFQWSFPGGDPATSTDENPTVTYSTVGSYNVELTVSNSVGDNTAVETDYITVNDLPTASFGSAPNGLSVSFSAAGTGALSYNWLFGDGNTGMGANPTHVYDTDGTYTVELVATNTCGSVSVTEQVVVVTAPSAAFSADATVVCAGALVAFSSQASDNTTGWLWSFPGGNPATSNLENPTVEYPVAGSFDVTLTVTNAAGSDETTQSGYITVGDAPTANFNSSGTGATYAFTSTSTDADSYLWDFGDGNTSTDENPTHSYATPGNYTVTLTVTNACGNASTSETVSFVLPPAASFGVSATTICQGESIDFTDQSTNNPTDWQWTFAGGTPATSTAQNVSVLYNTPGTYDVTLTVSNSAGTDTDASATTITVLPLPAAAFDQSVDMNTVTLTNTSSDADTYLWDFGDGNSSTDFEPTHTYASSGSYTVTLTATNGCGTTTSTATVAIAGSGPPIAAFGADVTAGCAPLTVSFANQSSNNSDSFSWSFPGGNPATSSEANPVVTYDTPGTYAVMLTATNSEGADVSSQSAYITVLDVPSGSIDVSAGGLTVDFSADSDDADNYAWDFGNGTASTEPNATVTYDTPGTYTVTLTLSNACGSTVLTEEVVVSEGAQLPVPSFSADEREGCGPFEVQFNDESLNNPTNWEWTFEGGDPMTSTEENPVVTYNEAGEYSVQLLVGNAAGNNVLVAGAYITVLPAPEAAFTYAQDQLTLLFEAQGPGDTYFWDFDDGTTATGASPEHTFPTQGTYLVSLTVTNECGTATSTEEITVLINGVSDALQLARFEVQPNPNAGDFRVYLEGPASTDKLHLQLVDVLGRTHQRRVLDFSTGRASHGFQTDLAAGVYLLHARLGSRTLTRRVVID